MSAPPNTCQEVLANISGYLDGELDTTACDAIERHCLECASCAGLVNGLRETVGLCRQAATIPLQTPSATEPARVCGDSSMDKKKG